MKHKTQKKKTRTHTTRHRSDNDDADGSRDGNESESDDDDESRESSSRSSESRESSSSDNVSTTDSPPSGDRDRDRERPGATGTLTRAPTALALRSNISGVRGILQQVQKDYQQCSRLSVDYKQKHREMMEMYLSMNKLLTLWQKGNSSDNTLSSELLNIVQNADILPQEELRALRKANDKVMREVYAETTEIDKEYFSTDNPIFKDLTSEQQREVLQNKQSAHSLLKKRMKAMGMLQTPGTEDARYRIAFSNHYFGEKEDFVNTAWGTDDLIIRQTSNHTNLSMFSKFLETNIKWFRPAHLDTVGRIIDARRSIAYKIRSLLDQMNTPKTHGRLGYLQSVFEAARNDTESTQLTDLNAFLNEQPILFNERSENDDGAFSQWNEYVSDLFANELDVMFYASTKTLAPASAHFDSPCNPARTILISSDKDATRIPLFVESDAYVKTEECTVHIPQQFVQTDLKLVRRSKAFDDTGITTVSQLFPNVVGTVNTRYDALYQLVWSACVHSGKSYPIIPSLHFVSGLNVDLLETDEMVFWCTEGALTDHIKKTERELNDPSYDEVHIKGDFRALEQDEEPFLLWKEHLSRDTRAFLSLDEVTDQTITADSEQLTTISIVDQRWLQKLQHDVGVIGPNPASVEDHCLRLFMAITDKTQSSKWLNPNESIVAKDIVDTLEKKLFVDEGNAMYETYGPLLITLYIQLGKTRVCPFSPDVGNLVPTKVFDDIKNALNTQMELLEHIAVNALHDRYSAHAKKDVYTKDFFAKWNDTANEDRIVFCWQTFKNVFGIPQLHPWKREVDPTTCARELKEMLLLDILPIDADIEVPVLTGAIDILRNSAYSRMDDATVPLVASPSQAHFLRLVLWNISAWDVSLEDPDYMQHVETQLNRLIKHGHHPFQEALSIEDVSYGHVSPLLVARLFVLCARYNKLSNKHRKELLPVFKTAYDNVVTKIRHPVFLAVFLKFRGHFLQVPDVHYLYKLWHMVDIGLWQSDNALWDNLLEYATAVEFIGNPSLMQSQHNTFFEELENVKDCTKQVQDMSDSSIAKMRRTLQEHFVDAPKHEGAEKVAESRKTHKKRQDRDREMDREIEME